MRSLNVWVVGAGPMALDYVKVLIEVGAHITVVGRGAKSASHMQETYGVPVIAGGLDNFLIAKPALPDAAIVAVGVEVLASVAAQLLNFGVKKILLEKPGALSYTELSALQQRAQSLGADIYIAYNRRMYAAVMAANQMIEEDGGIQSMHFEFTEWGHVIESISKAPGVKEAWVLANSTHVIDLAFYLGGTPTELNAVTAGTSLCWHPSASIFSGAGKTDRGVLFSYQANWDAPGRWSLEVLSRHRRFIFRPMETLQVMRRGSVSIDQVVIDDKYDKNFKPGLYKQVDCFLNDSTPGGLCTINDQLINWPIYEKIAGYVSM
ncbi:Gfo/Idh/MocA family oxidoreductase [Parvibium lacunae]|uniref:Gfo/Idh/MocA family oxidoreductase n=1 Tax=Parvibium lacunae TaxID=1888893 RepID=A0A368L1J0_9BURK|nr:Gfo/Idh/MocA family oxidoreductase [Parvibium lacunae]RCS57427.1 gfo/Idh/MocA family oxidoreductase [Parvibium lacunae]